MSKDARISSAKLQLARDFNCRPADFDLNSTRLLATHANPARRQFSKEKPFFKMASFGSCCVLNCDEAIRSELEDLVKDQVSTELFQTENLVRINQVLSVHGFRLGPTHELYLHDDSTIGGDPTSFGDFKFRFHQDEQVEELYHLEGFGNALQYDKDSLRPDIFAVAAYSGNRVAGVAGASRDCPDLCQIGVDVLPGYRRMGLGARLVQILTSKIHASGAVPYYGTWNGNLASRNLARKAGYFPCWIENYSIPG